MDRPVVPLTLAAAALTLAIVATTPVPAVLAWLSGAGVVTLAADGWDQRRTDEHARLAPSTKALLVLAGGVLGGWIGRWAFRRQVRTRIERLTLWIASILWVAISVPLVLA